VNKIKDANDMLLAGKLDADIEALEAEVMAKMAAQGAVVEADKERALVERPEPKRGIGLIKLSSVVKESISWLWNNVFAYGVLNCIQGVPGVGKSYLMCAIVAAISRGGLLPRVPIGGDGDLALEFETVKCGKAIIFSGDDTASTLRERIEEAGGDCDNILLVEDGNIPALDSPDLEAMFEEHKPALVVYDMLQHVIPPGVNMNNINEAAAAFRPIKVLAEKYKACVLFIQHTSKFSSSNGGNSVHFGIGSVGINGIMRTVWTVGHVKDDEGKNTGVRGFAISKTNIGASNLPCVLFGIEHGRERVFNWAGYSDLTAEDLVYVPKPNHRPNKRNDAAEYIRKELTKGERLHSELKREAEAMFGISDRSFRRALAEAGGKSERGDLGGYVCKLAV